MRIAVYPGSFDPITLGHVNIIERVSKHFDQVIVLVAQSRKKKYLFSPEERCDMVGTSLEHVKQIKVELFEGLTVDFAAQVGAAALIRGLRTVSDFDSEMAMAEVNSHLNSKLETFLVFAEPRYRCVSSQLVKEVAHLGGNLQGLLPQIVEQKLKEKLWSFPKEPEC